MTNTAIFLACLGLSQGPGASHAPTRQDFDVVIAGGSTAAFAAAIASAGGGARTALLEPTDWVGGQLTSSGVPAVDEAWHRRVDPATKTVVLDVATNARRRENMTPNFRAMLDATGNPGRGWVSNYCFEPIRFLDAQLLPLERAAGASGKLVVFRETVVKRVIAKDGRIVSLTAIRRTPRPGLAARGYDRLPSADLADWYSATPSDRFDKEVLEFPLIAPDGRPRAVIDATEWGEVLALGGGRYLQGVEAVDGGLEGDDACGQATVFDLVERIEPKPTDEPPGPTGVDRLGFGSYASKPDAWDLIWTYRRIRGKSAKPAVGDLSLQNWGYSGRDGHGGNDYPFGYLFTPRSAAAAERADWRGGVDLAVMAAAERRALAWHAWFKEHAPRAEGIEPGQVILDRGALGTAHGLAKLPYIRDTRRSVGLDGYVLKFADIAGPAARVTGTRFKDRVAIGAYPADIHGVVTCTMPAYVHAHDETLPYYIPLRALTNGDFSNLLVAGKTMAQSFLTNSATRLHPIEWSSGTAAGVVAASMASRGDGSRQALGRVAELQARIRARTPIDWTIDGVRYPRTEDETSW